MFTFDWSTLSFFTIRVWPTHHLSIVCFSDRLAIDQIVGTFSDFPMLYHFKYLCEERPILHISSLFRWYNCAHVGRKFLTSDGVKLSLTRSDEGDGGGDTAINATCRLLPPPPPLTKWTKPQGGREAHAIKTVNTSRVSRKTSQGHFLVVPWSLAAPSTINKRAGLSCNWSFRRFLPLTSNAPIDSLLHTGTSWSWDEVIRQKHTDSSSLIFILLPQQML